MGAVCSWNSSSVLSHLFFLHVMLLGREQVIIYFKLFIVAWKNHGQVPPNRDIPQYEGKLLNIGFASSFM